MTRVYLLRIRNDLAVGEVREGYIEDRLVYLEGREDYLDYFVDLLA